MSVGQGGAVSCSWFEIVLQFSRGKIRVFNLAVWQSRKNCQIKNCQY